MTNDNQPYLIAGLGNPGKQYAETRHNVGFMTTNEIAKRLNVSFRRMQSKAMVTKAQYIGNRVILAKPRAYMNLSGQPVSALVRFYKVPLENVLIIYDDVDLDFGVIRLRQDGSSGGQKGMQSIIQQLGTDEIPRIRIGLGRPPGRMETPDYVLQNFSRSEQELLPQILETAADAALLFIAEGIISAMNTYNAKII